MSRVPRDEPADARVGRQGFSRRAALGMLGGGAVAVGASALVAGRLQPPGVTRVSAASGVVPFLGEHQAGITTPAQDRLHFATFDVTTRDRAQLVTLLQQWSAAAEQLTQGRPVGGPDGALPTNPLAPPDDTGEALGLAPAHLTLTIGFGPALFVDADGRDRFGLADRRPEALVELPRFPGDALDPQRSGGDLCIQACSDDPQVAVHAIRNLTRIAFGTASVRWSQLGFGRTSSTSTTQQTPRNLFGFKDGTANLKAEDGAALDEHVWVQPGDGVAWMTGGSYLVSRRIQMIIETWDRQPLREQELIIGRDKGGGAPLSGGTELSEPDLAATGADGRPVIPVDSHVRLAHPSQNGGARLLRRGYNYVDGTDGLGRLDAGLFFLAYQRDPRTGFIPVQRNLAGTSRDAMNEYVVHVGSAVFACPPGVAPGTWWGQGLFS